MSRNGAWGLAMAREVREGSRELPRVSAHELEAAQAVARAVGAVDEAQAELAAWETAHAGEYRRLEHEGDLRELARLDAEWNDLNDELEAALEDLRAEGRSS